MFNKTNFRIASLLKTGQWKQRPHDYLHVTDGFTEVTNGHYLMRVDSVKLFKKEGLPIIANIKPKKGKTECLVSKETAQLIEKTIPKSKDLPILEHAWIGANNDKEKTTFVITDMVTETPIVSRNADFQYPATTKLFQKQKEKEPKIEIALDPDYMARLCQQFVKAGITYIKLAIYNETETMRLIGTNTETQQEIKALLMPVRL